MKLRFFSASLISLVCGCSGGDASISGAVASQFESGGAGKIDLSLVGPKTWDKVCVLKPYTDNRTAEHILGVKWNAEAKTSIVSSDSINVLVFLQGTKVAGFSEHPRDKGDFSRVEPNCVSRSDATFSRETDDDGWVYLIIANGV